MSLYQHKKFDLKSEEYSHKKFGSHMNKRKHEDLDDKENYTAITVQTILKQAAKEQKQQQPPAKRRQTKPLFRPWLGDVSKNLATPKATQQKTSPPKILPTTPTNIMSYHCNMARQHPAKPRSEIEQERRNRNTLACLLNRRHKQAEQFLQQQQYAVYHQQQAAIMQESVRSALYLRHLQQLALQRQQRLFVFGHL